MTLNEQLEDFAITQDAAKEARAANDEFKHQDRAIASATEIIQDCATKIELYRRQHSGEYVGGVECSTLLLRCAAWLQIHSAR